MQYFCTHLHCHDFCDQFSLFIFFFSPFFFKRTDVLFVFSMAVQSRALNTRLVKVCNNSSIGSSRVMIVVIVVIVVIINRINEHPPGEGA